MCHLVLSNQVFVNESTHNCSIEQMTQNTRLGYRQFVRKIARKQPSQCEGSSICDGSNLKLKVTVNTKWTAITFIDSMLLKLGRSEFSAVRKRRLEK